MKIMFSILGEGRGHMTQAIAVKEMVEKAGHQVTQVVLGVGSHRQVAPYFASAMKMPITQIPTPDFSFKNDRKVNLTASLAGHCAEKSRLLACRPHGEDAGARNPARCHCQFLRTHYRPLRTDLPKPSARRVAWRHQFMFEHPSYVRAPGKRLQQFGMKWYIRMVGGGATRLALSLYEAPDLPRKKADCQPAHSAPAIVSTATQPRRQFRPRLSPQPRLCRPNH